MSFFPVGPATLFLGNPTTALGAGMRNLGATQTTGVNLGLRSAFVSNASLSGVPLSTGRYKLAPEPEVQAQLQDAAVATLAVLVQRAVQAAVSPITVPSLGLGSAFEQVAESAGLTLCVLPDSQRALGVAAPNAIWFPDVGIMGLDGFSFGEVSPGRIQNPYNVRFTAGERKIDHNAVPIPAAARIAFIGPPANFALTWSLPA